jgi:hypothetical protein
MGLRTADRLEGADRGGNTAGHDALQISISATSEFALVAAFTDF